MGPLPLFWIKFVHFVLCLPACGFIPLSYALKFLHLPSELCYLVHFLRTVTPWRNGTGERWLDSPIPEWYTKLLSFTAWSWSIKTSGFLEPVHCSSCEVSGKFTARQGLQELLKHWKLPLYHWYHKEFMAWVKRSLTLLRCDTNIWSKCIPTRIERVGHGIINMNQSVFMQGRL